MITTIKAIGKGLWIGCAANGSIKIKSAEGKGTTVWFAIPCTAKEIERKYIQ